MEKAYVFKVASKYFKTDWKQIEIKDDQTLGDFDRIIREAFDYDMDDHLSQFFSGKVWRSEGFGEINFSGSGPGSKKRIKKIGLSVGDKMEYVYDFGDDFQHIIILKKIEEIEQGIKYPRITPTKKMK